MFLKQLINKNKEFINVVENLYDLNQILPDTYCIDVDTFMENSLKIINEANKYGIKLYYMLKQLGRNPYLAKKLEDIGYGGAVCVDFKEAEIMMKNNLKIGNVGHLVQIPKSMLRKIINYGVEIITVYSLEVIEEISKIALEEDKVQDIMLKIISNDSSIYPGQESGFTLEDIKKILNRIINLKGVRINGLTSFPCFLFDEEKKIIEKTNNLDAINEVKNYLIQNNIYPKQINLPSATTVENIKNIFLYGGTHGEPGHGLSGTCPINILDDSIEIPSYLYISEISHRYKDKSYFYGGGFYPRGNMKYAYINNKITSINKFNSDNIDYYFSLDGNYNIFEKIILCFRTQIFVTRSDVVLIEGIKNKNPIIVGRYSSIGIRKE